MLFYDKKINKKSTVLGKIKCCFSNVLYANVFYFKIILSRKGTFFNRFKSKCYFSGAFTTFIFQQFLMFLIVFKCFFRQMKYFLTVINVIVGNIIS